jgi:REP element-mobilizing transposase RayT
MLRKTLHHYTEIESYQFITFRTQDSIDPYLHKISKMINLTTSERQMKIDCYCDQSDNGCYLNDEVINILMTHLKLLDPDFYQLIAFSIMPNHVHLLIQQKQALATIMQKIKGAMAFKINKLLSRKGHFWEKSYFDKTIRDGNHFNIVYKYIENNAIKAGLADKDSRFYGIYNN